jgi:MFS family permease
MRDVEPERRQADAAARTDRAWGVVAGAGLLMFINLGPVLYYTNGVFAKAMIDDMSWSRGDIAAAGLPGNLLMTLTLPLVGWGVDRFGTRRIALVSSILFAIGLGLLGQFSTSLTSYAALLMLATLFGFGLSPLPPAHIVSGWFERRRGLALGLTLALSGVGTAVFPPISSKLIELVGWRHAYGVLGLAVLAVGVVSSLALLRDPPRRGGGSVGDAAGLPVSSVLRRGAFWILLVGFFLISMAIGGGATSLPLVLTDAGAPAQQASFVMSALGAMMVVGRIASGALLDRFFAPRLTALVFLFPAAAFAVLLFAPPTQINAMIAAGLIGFGLGAEVDALAFIASRAFGLRHFGRVFGLLMIAFSFGVSFGPTLFGKIHDRFQSYAYALWLACAFCLAASALVATLRRSDLPFAARDD